MHVGLDLQGALDAVYAAAAYVDMLDYRHGTDLPLPPSEVEWAEAIAGPPNGFGLRAMRILDPFGGQNL